MRTVTPTQAFSSQSLEFLLSSGFWVRQEAQIWDTVKKTNEQHPFKVGRLQASRQKSAPEVSRHPPSKHPTPLHRRVTEQTRDGNQVKHRDTDLHLRKEKQAEVGQSAQTHQNLSGESFTPPLLCKRIE